MSEQEGERGRGSTDPVVIAWRDLQARHATVAWELDRVLHEHRLGMSDFEVLDRLADAGDRMRMHHLAEAVHLSQSALSRLVSRLEREGLLNRTMCADDRRGIFVWLTEAGRRKHAAALPAQRAVLAAHLGTAATHSTSPTTASGTPAGELALAEDRS